jgi:crotonobetainyl-CoA:carnitine CoA-transferase CaiB-like acyl-CoA transferase
MYACLAITAALHHRQIYGVGQYIDMALFDSIVAFSANQILNFWVSGQVPRRWGNAHINIAPYEVFPTADGHIILAVGNDTQFAGFCTVAGQPELARDPRFSTNPDRLRHRATLVGIVRALLKQRTSADWIEALERANVPCGPINDLKQVFEDPQARARGAAHRAGDRVSGDRSPATPSVK